MNNLTNKFSIALSDQELQALEEQRNELQLTFGMKVSRSALIRRILMEWLKQQETVADVAA